MLRLQDLHIRDVTASLKVCTCSVLPAASSHRISVHDPNIHLRSAQTRSLYARRSPAIHLHLITRRYSSMLAATRVNSRIYPRIPAHTRACSRISAHTRAYSRILAHSRAYSRIPAHISAHTPACPRIPAHTRAYPRIPAHTRAYPRIPGPPQAPCPQSRFPATVLYFSLSRSFSISLSLSFSNKLYHFNFQLYNKKNFIFADSLT